MSLGMIITVSIIVYGALWGYSRIVMRYHYQTMVKTRESEGPSPDTTWREYPAAHRGRMR